MHLEVYQNGQIRKYTLEENFAPEWDGIGKST